jgi:hypothetical protein
MSSLSRQCYGYGFMRLCAMMDWRENILLKVMLGYGIDAVQMMVVQGLDLMIGHATTWQ